MKNAEEYGIKNHGSNSAAKTAINILVALLCALLAFSFAVYGYNYRAVKLISEHFNLLVYGTATILILLLAGYYVAYFMKKQAVFRLILCALIFLDVGFGIFYIINATGLITKITSIDELRNYISGFGATAVFIFILFQFLQVVILPVPGSVSVAVGVALFGPFNSAIFSLIGILLGSITAFAIGRIIGYKAVCWIVGKEDLDKWLKKIKGKDYLLLSIMFLLPLFPDDILCFVAGLSSMTWLYFIAMIIATRVISVFTTSYSIDLIPFNTWWGLTIWLLIAAAVGVMFWLVCKYSDTIDRFIKGVFKRKNNKNK